MFGLSVLPKVRGLSDLVFSRNSVSYYRGPRSFGLPVRTLLRMKLSYFSLRSVISVDSLFSELGPLRSEDRGPFGASSDVGTFGLSMTSALDLVVF